MKRNWTLATLVALLAPSCIATTHDPYCEPYPAQGPAAAHLSQYDGQRASQYSDQRGQEYVPVERYQSRPENYDRRVESVHLLVGEMELREDSFWQPLDEPTSFGIEYASTNTGTNFGPELGVHFWGDSTGSSSTDEDLKAVEISAGIRNTWDAGRNRPHPYIGVGGTLIAASLEGPGFSEDDGSFGLYGHAGITMPLGPALEIGVDYRIVRGTDSDFPGLVDSDYDYDRLALVIGWSF